MEYPVRLTKDGAYIVASFADVPEAHTIGETRKEALARAPDALATALEEYIRRRQPIPAPSPRKGPKVVLSALVEAKVALYNVMRRKKVWKAGLAKRLGWHLPQVDRLLDMRHASRLDQIEQALNVLHKRLRCSVVDSDGMNDVFVVRRHQRAKEGPKGRRPTSRDQQPAPAPPTAT